MAKQYFSPYRARGPRSPRLTMIWLACFLFILWATWYISSGRMYAAKPYVDEFVHPGGHGHGAEDYDYEGIRHEVRGE
ncbi:hypothetical protein QBC35DRAFT_454821 [Podospora australis]|uniref:Uncharacterized protein n=1 Tax=Podospora australis TaxID=1536484 RepID=A0AAN7AGE6_9PEZI|nr:hypothetical protein QBC35DRAFT_454821 [Podospora australis]